MAIRRRTAITAAAVVLALAAAGGAVWLMMRPQKSDCATVNEMLSYSQAENDRMRNLIPDSVDDPQKMITAYQKREARMHQYANQIHAADLREKANGVVDLDDRMLDVWRKTIPSQPDSSAGNASDKDFERSYTDYATQRAKAAEALQQSACAVSK